MKLEIIDITIRELNEWQDISEMWVLAKRKSGKKYEIIRKEIFEYKKEIA